MTTVDIVNVVSFVAVVFFLGAGIASGETRRPPRPRKHTTTASVPLDAAAPTEPAA